MSQAKHDEIATFVAERNALLLEGDLDRLIAFMKRHDPGMLTPTRAVQEIMLHKARSAATGLPVAMRRASKHWLERRGYRSFDDGDL